MSDLLVEDFINQDMTSYVSLSEKYFNLIHQLQHFALLPQSEEFETLHSLIYHANQTFNWTNYFY